MTYEEALNKIHERLKFGNKLTLTRIRELLHLLGDPHESLRVIHVAGTNGKGSVSKYIYHVLSENGFKVGLYTSPYIIDFRERIECDGNWISRDELTVLTERVFDAVQLMETLGSDSPTEFEIVMAIAFLYYEKMKCDYVVLEVGLGGRGDATNIIKAPLVSIITSISFDHMEYLGNTLAEIAEEKAGIIKRSCPVVYDVRDQSAAEVIQKKAGQMHSRAFAVQDFVRDISVLEATLEGSSFSVSVLGQKYENVFTPLPGLHQINNAITALTALAVLQTERNICLDREKIIQGMAKTKHVARFEIIGKHPLMIIDGAHNVEGMNAFCDSIKPFIANKKTLFVLGILRDKEYKKMLETVLLLDVDIAVSEPENARKASAEELGAAIEAMGGKAEVIGDAQHAVSYVKNRVNQYECVLFAGSLYFVSVIREAFYRRKGAGMKIRYEETKDCELLVKIFESNEIEVEEDEFSGGRTALVKGFAAFDEESENKLVGAIALAKRMNHDIINRNCRQSGIQTQRYCREIIKTGYGRSQIQECEYNLDCCKSSSVF